MKKLFLLLAIIICINVSAQNTWVQKANFGGTGRTYAVGFSIGSKGYIGTGQNGNGQFIDFWEYDPATDTWTQKANFGGAARIGAFGFSIGNKGYVGDGEDAATEFYDFWEYNPVTNSWTQKATVPGDSRSRAFSFSIGNKGYLGGGFTGGTWNQDFYEYDPLTDAWASKAIFPGNNTVEAAYFTINNKGYVGTGADQNSNFCYREFWEYDPITDSWTQKADFGGDGRCGAVGFSIGNSGFIGAGINYCGASYGSDFWEYNPNLNFWKHRADVITGSSYQHAVGFSIGTKGYIGTGASTVQYSNEFHEYTPDTISFTCAASFALYADTIPHSYVGINNSGGVAPVTYAWNWGDGNFSSGAFPSHTYSTAGIYNICLTITDAMGCIDSFCYSSYLFKNTTNATMVGVHFIGSTTGMEETDQNNNSIGFTPNPAKDNIHLVFNANEKGPMRCEILNTVGKKVLEKTFASDASLKEYDLDISSLAKGIYFVRVGDGLKWENRKIVVQ